MAALATRLPLGVTNSCTVITAGTFSRPAHDALVSEFDVRIAIHNHGPSHRYNKAIDVVNAVKGHHPLIGACADLGHYIRSGEDPVEVIKLLVELGGEEIHGDRGNVLFDLVTRGGVPAHTPAASSTSASGTRARCSVSGSRS